jgi:Plasmid pRiA4b ORF-3-like protein
VQSVHQLKIELRGMRPPVWRRVVVPSQVSLGSLHDVVQVLFGWQDEHLHAFEDKLGRRFAPAHEGDDSLFGVTSRDEDANSLADAAPRPGDRVTYTYDFGDDWEHLITVEQVRPAEDGEGSRAVCTGGRRAMPDAEDLGGVWALAELLARWEAGERPRPTIVTEDGEEWQEFDSLADEVLAEMAEAGFDPARLERAGINEILAGLPLRTAPRDGKNKSRNKSKGKKAGPEGRGVLEGFYLCECGDVHPLPGEQEQPAELLPGPADELGISAPPVRLREEAELAAAVRRVEHFMAAVRLGHWCAGGRELTPKGLLRPGLAREAVEELELWRIAPEEWGERTARTARLAKIRSAGDMEIVDRPWQWAQLAGFVDTEGGQALPGPELPDVDDDEALLAAWRSTMACAVGEAILELPEVEGFLGSLPGIQGLLDGAPPLTLLMLLAAYTLPDGEWADVHGLYDAGLEGLPQGAARQLVGALLAAQYDEMRELLELFGAAESEGVATAPDTSAVWPFGPGEASDLLPTGRFRLTPLGRAGIRELLVAIGVPAPVIGQLAQAEATELLAALGSYPSLKEAHSEIDGWLESRNPTDAAVQVVDACAGDSPADAHRRLAAPLVLERLLEADPGGRARGVLRKAAVSGVPGCSHTAASFLRRIGDPAEGQAPWGREWMLVDGLFPYAALGAEELLLRLQEGPEGGPRVADQVAELADDLWRTGHPHTQQVLTTLADTVKAEDKALSKRLRKAAFKVGNAE